MGIELPEGVYLLACPFMQGQLEIVDFYYDVSNFCVQCKCGAEGPFADTVQGAIDAWNERTYAATLQALTDGTAAIVQQLGDLTTQRDRAVKMEREWCTMAMEWQSRTHIAEQGLQAMRLKTMREIAGHQCWMCFQELPFEQVYDERYHIRGVSTGSPTRTLCLASAIWVVIMQEEQDNA